MRIRYRLSSKGCLGPPQNSSRGYILHILNYLINTLHKETPGYEAARKARINRKMNETMFVANLLQVKLNFLSLHDFRYAYRISQNVKHLFFNLEVLKNLRVYI